MGTGGGLYSTTIRWEGRARESMDRPVGRGQDKRPAARPMLAHSLRSLDVRDGTDVAHSNEMIDPGRISDNVVMIADGDGFRRAGDSDTSQSIMESAMERIESGFMTRKVKGVEKKVAVRKDATILMEAVIQLDPDYTGKIVDMTDGQKEDAREKMWSMVEVLKDQVGSHNMVFVAEHWDESHPHFHVFYTPMTKEGEMIGSRIMGAGKADWAKFHDRLRTKLREVGYDATFDRVDKGRGHEELAEFKARRDRERAVVEGERKLDRDRGQFEGISEQIEVQLERKEEDLQWRSAQVDEIEAAAKAKADEILAEAKTKADKIKADANAAAEDAVEAAVEGAMAEMDRSMGIAEEVAKDTKAKAETEAKSIRSKANAEAEVMIADAQRRLEDARRRWEEAEKADADAEERRRQLDDRERALDAREETLAIEGEAVMALQADLRTAVDAVEATRDRMATATNKKLDELAGSVRGNFQAMIVDELGCIKVGGRPVLDVATARAQQKAREKVGYAMVTAEGKAKYERLMNETVDQRKVGMRRGLGSTGGPSAPGPSRGSEFDCGL